MARVIAPESDALVLHSLGGGREGGREGGTLGECERLTSSSKSDGRNA